MEETTTKNAWLQDAMKKGLILGVVHIVIFLLIYMLVPSKLTGFSYLTLILVLNIGYSIYCGRQWRNQLGGFMGYGEAFKYAFMLLLFNGIIGSVFAIIFLLVDPSYPETMADSQLDTSLYWAQKFGAPEATVDQMREKFDRDEMVGRYGFAGMLKGFGIVLIFYAIGASLIALFTRKNKPETL